MPLALEIKWLTAFRKAVCKRIIYNFRLVNKELVVYSPFSIEEVEKAGFEDKRARIAFLRNVRRTMKFRDRSYHWGLRFGVKYGGLISLWVDLHSTIFVACDKRTTGLLHDLRLTQRFKTCFKMHPHLFWRTQQSQIMSWACRKPLSHTTKIVPCKSALRQ